LKTCKLDADTVASYPVIELSGGWEGSTPSSFFNPPACPEKLPWGIRLNPPEQRSIA